MMRNFARLAISQLKRAIHRRGLIGVEELFDIDWYLKQNADVSAAGGDPLFHFVTHGAYEGRDPNPLFDSEWYKTNYQEAAHSGLSPLSHFITIGAHKGYDPHPLFRLRWYLANNPDVRATRLNPLADFLMNGQIKRREPHPLFNTAWYLQRYPDTAEYKMNPLVHYLMSGAARGYDPNPYFDSSWYLVRYPDVAYSRINPLRHYIELGAKEGRDPSLRFETEWYRTKNMLGDENPLEHFLTIGLKSGCAPLSRMGLRRNAAIDIARTGFAGLTACDPELTAWIDESSLPALPTRANVAAGPAFAAWKTILASLEILYDRMIVVGSLSDVASGTLAANALRLSHQTRGIDSVLLVVTDHVPADHETILKGTHVTNLSEIDRTLLPDHRAEIVQKLIYHLQPKFVLNANSLALWRTMAKFGAPLSSVSRIFALFNYPPKDDRQREIVCHLRPSLPFLQQLILDGPDSLSAAVADFGLLALDQERLATYNSFTALVTDGSNSTDGRRGFSRCWFDIPSSTL